MFYGLLFCLCLLVVLLSTIVLFNCVNRLVYCLCRRSLYGLGYWWCFVVACLFVFDVFYFYDLFVSFCVVWGL